MARALYAAAAASVVAVVVTFAVELARAGTLRPSRLSAILAWGGLSCLCFGAGWGVRVLPHLLRGRVAAGRITQRLGSEDDRAEVVVRYSVDDVEHEVQSVAASGPAAGDEVQVLCPPGDPSDGRVKGWGLYVWPAILIGMGALFVCQWAIRASGPPDLDIPIW